MRLTPTVALAACVLAMACPSPAGAAEKAIWGPVQLARDGELKSAFPLYRSLDVDVLHYVINWASVAPTPPEDLRDPTDPAYRWPADLDFAIEQGRRNGVQILAMVEYAPRWANGDRDMTWAPNRAQDYADFVYAAARRYPGIRRWMIWGEPSRQAQFNPMPKNSPVGPRRYARLLDRAYGALKRADPRNIVIGGNTFTVGDVSPADFIRWMRLPNGKPPRLDWFGHNPFSTRFPELKDGPLCSNCRDFGDIDTYIREIRRTYRRIGRKPKLWLSEWTIQSDHASDVFQFYVSREAQANWVRAGYRIARTTPYVAGLGWYQLQDERGPEGGVSRNWGLMTLSGERKPSFFAYRRAFASAARYGRARHRACIRRARKANGRKQRTRMARECNRRWR